MTQTDGCERSALVTGGSRGIGKVVARRLAALGYAVVVNYRAAQREALDVVHSIETAGGRAYALQADLANPEQAGSLVERSEAVAGPVAILVNNAGITRDRLLLQMTEEDWFATWNTDLVGARTVAREALRRMMHHGSGHIVNVSSVVGPLGNAGQANYAAAKSAILGLTRQMAVDAAPHRITVNCVIPGYVETDATSHLTPDQRQAWLDRIPMGHPTTSDAIADCILFLASDAAAYITGQCIAVDGGLLASAGQGWAS